MSVPASIKIKGDYKAIQSAEEESLLPKPSSVHASVNTQNKKKKPKRKRKKRKPVSCWKLIFNMSFLFFAVNCLTPIAIFGWWFMIRPDTQIPYILSGILGILISTTGYRTTTKLIALTTQANHFTKNNTKMRGEHKAIRTSVGSIKKANKELKACEHRLRAANIKNQENLTNFRDVQKFMKELKIDDFKEVTAKAANLGRSWHAELLQQERNMLHLIFDRYEMDHDGKEAMTQKEFEQFAACLPEQYQKRFARLGTFDKLSNNKGVLEYADFELVLDIFAEMIVDNVDIEVDLVKTPNPNVDIATLDINPANNISEQDSIMSDYDNDSDDENNDGGGGGFGFLNKLTTWRKGRKQDRVRKSANLSRRLIITAQTPISGTNANYGFDTYNAESDISSTHLSPKYNSNNNNKFNLQAVTEDSPVLTKNSAPKSMKTKATIEAAHNIDAMSLDDDEIN
eukprot:980372_1